MATRIPVPAAFLIASEVSFGVQLRSIWTVFTVGTSFLATSRRDACKSVMTIGVQPAAWEARRVTKPIGPAPLMTVSDLQSNRSERGSPNQDRVTQAVTSPLKGRQSNGKRLAQCAFLVREVVGKTVEPRGRVGMKTSQSTMVGRSREEDNLRTYIIVSKQAHNAKNAGRKDSQALYLPVTQGAQLACPQGTPHSIATLSPTFHWLTPGPTSTTSPADS